MAGALLMRAHDHSLSPTHTYTHKRAFANTKLKHTCCVQSATVFVNVDNMSESHQAFCSSTGKLCILGVDCRMVKAQDSISKRWFGYLKILLKCSFWKWKRMSSYNLKWKTIQNSYNSLLIWCFHWSNCFFLVFCYKLCTFRFCVMSNVVKVMFIELF